MCVCVCVCVCLCVYVFVCVCVYMQVDAREMFTILKANPVQPSAPPLPAKTQISYLENGSVVTQGNPVALPRTTHTHTHTHTHARTHTHEGEETTLWTRWWHRGTFTQEIIIYIGNYYSQGEENAQRDLVVSAGHAVGIVFRNVHFEYGTDAGGAGGGAGGHGLRGFDLTVAAGSTVAIVGESGCGKSTLTRLV